MAQLLDIEHPNGAQPKSRRGRPFGSVGLPGRLRAAIAEAAPDILANLIERARADDAMTAQWLISRILPSARSAPLAAKMVLPPAHDAAAGVVLQRLSNGGLTLEEAKALLEAIEKVQAIAQGSALMDRLRLVEERLALLGERGDE